MFWGTNPMRSNVKHDKSMRKIKKTKAMKEAGRQIMKKKEEDRQRKKNREEEWNRQKAKEA